MPNFRRSIMSLAAALVLAGGASLAVGEQAGAAATPHLVVVPVHGSSSHGFVNGQRLNISMGPNHLFKPYSHVNILECADPKGTKKGLPKDDSTCDGNTIQDNTVLVAKNGSFSEHNYQLYALPNSVLGEEPTWSPVCNAKHPCVLYVGANQTDFTWPKVFSAPFVIATKKSAK